MRTEFDFAPLYRTAVGFDRLARVLDGASRVTDVDKYPPYNITRVDTDRYEIALAVAGFGKDDIEVVAQEGTLTVKGRIPDETRADKTYLHRGIAGRAFERRFQLADHILVTDAHLENGLLTVKLERQLPEEMKARVIPVSNGTARLEKKAA